MKEKVAFYTLGCKVNAYETNAMIQIFRQKGYEIVDFNEVADLYIVNTCTVTSSGIIFFSINALKKLYSVSDAAGNPTSICLNPI